MGNIFRGLDRSQQPISKSKNWIAVTLIQDLKSCRISVGCLFQQLLICYLIRQSKRSILQELASYCVLPPMVRKLRNMFGPPRKSFAATRLYYRSGLFEHPELFAMSPLVTGL